MATALLGLCLAALPLLSVARPLLLVERVTVRPALVLLRFPANIGGGLLFTLSPLAGVALLNLAKICVTGGGVLRV